MPTRFDAACHGVTRLIGHKATIGVSFLLHDAMLDRTTSGRGRADALPPTVRIHTQRLDFSSFPIIGYSLTSDVVPQKDLWETATYEIKPRLGSLPGAVIAAFLIGFISTLMQAKLPVDARPFRDAFVYAAVIVTLILPEADSPVTLI